MSLRIHCQGKLISVVPAAGTEYSITFSRLQFQLLGVVHVAVATIAHVILGLPFLSFTRIFAVS